jgi:hypothetical protein
MVLEKDPRETRRLTDTESTHNLHITGAYSAGRLNTRALRTGLGPVRTKSPRRHSRNLGHLKIAARESASNWTSKARFLGPQNLWCRTSPAKPRKYRGFSELCRTVSESGNAWLGREDSNLRMAESKSAALPLGDAPIVAVEQGYRLISAARDAALPRSRLRRESDIAEFPKPGGP